ncbi:hypothetical protein LUZ60_014948 [Juncus effusus]|nr:hypothetical protein LUZ60_014948 [Juncus effusus]
MSEINSNSDSAERNSDEGTSARTRPLGFEEIMQRRKNKLQTESAKLNIDSPKEASRSDDLPKEPSKMDDSPKEPSKMDASPKEPSKMDDLPEEASKMDESPKEPSRSNECNEEKEFVESKKEGWRLSSMVVSSNLERDTEKEELDEKVKERERKRSDDHERKKRKEDIKLKDEPISKKRDSRNEIDSGRSERKEKSKERDRSRERDRDRSKRRRSNSRDKSGERDRDRSKRRRSSGREKLERERGGRSREKLGGYSPRKRQIKDPSSEKKKSDERDQKERKSEKRKEKSPERKSEKRNSKFDKSPERKSGKRNDKSERSPERKSGKRNDRSERSPKSEKRNDRSERSSKSEKGNDRSERSPKSGKRNDRSERSPKSEKRNDKSESKAAVEKKSDKWDQLPAGNSVPVSVGSILGAFKMPGTKNVIQTGTRKTVPVEPVQLTQATRPQRRLLIENISDNISEKMLIDGINGFFSGTANPCLTCTINKEKRQAVVEFLTPDDATKALSFDGKNLLGTVLKIRRPKDYVETPSVAQEKPIEEEKVISNIVKDSSHKIFIAGISKALSSVMLMEIVSVFGPLNAYHFTYNEELGAPCAFLEYMDHSVTLKACAGLNGMKLAGSVLTVLTALPDQACEETEKPPFYDVPVHAKSLLVDPTEVLQLKNLFDLDEFLKLQKTELDEILEDIRLECTRFGTVKSVKVISHTQTANSTDEIITKAPDKEENSDSLHDKNELDRSINAPNGEDKADFLTGEDVLEAGTVLVEFVRKEATQMAAHVLHGRLFADRVVSTRYVPLELYLQKLPK